MSERCGKTAQCYDDLLKMMQNKDVSPMVLFSRNKEDDILLYTQQYVDKLNARIHDLQEEVEGLREDNYAYHQLIRMENKREYRSKFLKEFQEEFDTNTFPDYDEIYKRYDKVKKEKQKLEKIIIEQDEEQRKLFNHIVKKDYKQRIDKAIEYIEKQLECTKKSLEYHMKQYNSFGVAKDTRDCKLYANILEILRGDDNE